MSKSQSEFPSPKKLCRALHSALWDVSECDLGMSLSKISYICKEWGQIWVFLYRIFFKHIFNIKVGPKSIKF